MGKNSNFIGQPIESVIFLCKKCKIAKQNEAERYVKRFDTRTHLIVMLFGVISGYHSIRELIIGMLSNADRLQHLGISYMIRRSTLSDANKRRKSATFD